MRNLYPQFKTILIVIFLLTNVWLSFGQTSINVSCPWISQNVCNDGIWSLCGHTSVEMVLSKYENRDPSSNNTLTYNQMIRQHRNQSPSSSCSGSGTPNPNDLIWLVNQFGYQAKWYGSSASSYSNNQGELSLTGLANILNQGMPIIVQVHTSMNTSNGTHWMVLREIGTDYVKLNDPGTSYSSIGTNRSFTRQQFLDSWTSGACDKIALVISSKNTPNQSLPIYAGSTSEPKDFEVYFLKSQIDNKTPDGFVYNLEVGGKDINQTTAISTNSSWSSQIYRFEANPSNSIFSTLSNNNSYDISFEVKTTDGSTYKFSGSQQVQLKEGNSLNVSLGSGADWLEEYVEKGIRYGLFSGVGGISSTSFGSANYLTREQAAKVIVAAAIQAHSPNRIINSMNPSNYFTDDVALGDWSYSYIHTLRNWSVISGTSKFYKTDPITTRDFCRWLDLAMQFSSTDEAPLNSTSRVVVSIPGSVGNAANLQASMQRMNKILVNSGTSIINPNDKIEPIFASTDYSNVPSTYYFNGNIVTDGATYLTRAKMAKIITNAYIFAYKKYNNTYPNLRLNSSSQSNRELDITDVVVIGDKFENADITTGNALTVLSDQTYSVASGGSINIGAGSDYDEYGNPMHYYWSMVKNGATLTSNATSHRSVKFTAPTVSIPTTWKLYSYKANNKGKSFERIITINVGGTSGSTSAPPTQQAHSLTLYGATQNSITASWTRGNGQYCLVTCYEVQANAQDVPDPNVVYSGNSNFNSAPAIFNGSETKVVYTGTGNNVTITGLLPNTQYQVAIFEYNGNTPSTIKYNVTNPPLSRASTLAIVNNPPIASFTWDNNVQMVSGQTYAFTNTSQNTNSYLWSITPNATISNTTSSTSTNITFLTSGQHALTLKAINTSTGQYDTHTFYFYVFSPSEMMADLQPTNIDFTSPMIGGQNLTINTTIANNSNADLSYTTGITFVLSTDQIFDEGDHFMGTTDFTIGAGQTANITHTATNIYNSFAGNYYILGKVDYRYNVPNGYVPESNENNNIISKAITIQQALPDFVALSLTATPNTVSSGQTFSVTGTFRNIGAGDKNGYSPFASFYISTDNVLSVDDISLPYTLTPNTGGSLDYANSPIVSGTTNNIKLPYSLPNGNYYLFGAIDFSFYGHGYAWDGNVEISENNNWVSTPITVSNTNQPTINATNYFITNITDTSMRLSWTRGNGNACIVLGRAISDLPNLTIDGRSYTPNNNFSLAKGIRGYYLSNDNFTIDTMAYVKILYDGSGNFVDIFGLTPNETYSFVVLEYNGTGSNKDYFQITPLKGISAHTKGQNINTSFIRMFGSINATATGSYYSIISLKFFDANNGIIFKNINGIGKTSDGGNTWKFVNNNSVEKNKNGYLTGSSWLNNGYGWIVFENGNLIKTTDFGTNWTEKVLDRSINDVYFINQNTGYLALKGLINTSTNEGAIYKTTDGGNTWYSVGTFPRPVKSIFFLNEQFGWATTYSSTSGWDKIILKTINGGQTWSQTLFNLPNSGSDMVDIYFIDANNGFIMTLFGKLLRTTDGGLSWQEQNIFNIQSNINSYSKIDFVNSLVGFINLQNKKIAKTINGGNSWNIYDIQNDFPSQGVFAEIDALNENSVFVGGISGILKSTTGGSNNAIDIQTIQNTYCAGATINLPYSITGLYDANNSFNTELSNSLGSFSTPTILQTFSNAGNGTLNVSLPINIPQGSGYKIRIIATNPNIISDTTNAFTINASPNVAVALNRNPTGTVCVGNTIAFIANPTNGGSAPFYQWKVNGLNVGSNSNLYSSTQLKDGDIVWVELKSNASCASQTPVASTPITASVTSVDTPFIQAIDNTLAASTDVGIQWYLNGSPINGATSQFYEATQSGNYQVRVTQNGCTVSSTVYNHSFIITGIKDNFISDNVLSIFPNPNSGTFSVKMDKAINKNAQLAIYDVEGRVVHQQQLTNQQTDITTQNLASGVYIINIQLSENEMVKHKLVIVK